MKTNKSYHLRYRLLNDIILQFSLTKASIQTITVDEKEGDEGSKDLAENAVMKPIGSNGSSSSVVMAGGVLGLNIYIYIYILYIYIYIYFLSYHGP